MDAASPPVGVATTSPVPPPEWPQATQWMAAPGDLSVRLPSVPAPAWSRPAQGTAALLLLLAVVLLAWHTYAAQRWSCRPALLEANALDAPAFDLNRADHAQLLQLPGVGENLAQRIETYRAERGGFREVGELRQVAGIGAALLEKLRPLLYVQPSEREDEGDPPQTPVRRVLSETRKETPSLPVKKRKAELTQILDINRATGAELQQLPGIGPKLSQRILDARAKKAFASIDELRRVPGIGPKTLQRLRPHVQVVP